MSLASRRQRSYPFVISATIGAEIQLPFGGTKPTDHGPREAGGRGGALDLYSKWKVIYRDFSGKLQRAQIDRSPVAGETTGEQACKERAEGADPRCGRVFWRQPLDIGLTIAVRRHESVEKMVAKLRGELRRVRIITISPKFHYVKQLKIISKLCP
jgi:hypothetical protein